MKYFNQSTRYHETFYDDISSKNGQLLMALFLSETKEYEHDGRLKFKIYNLVYGDNTWTIIPRRMKFYTIKDMDIPTRLI
jgi:hypothetical protein